MHLPSVDIKDKYLIFNNKDVLIESQPNKVRAMRAVENLTEHAELHGHHETFYWKEKT